MTRVLRRPAPVGLAPELWLGAEALLLRLQADVGHSLRVCSHAAVLYDSLQDHYLIAPQASWLRDALLLAALLHDIGQVVAERGHHRHSHYLICNAEQIAYWQVDVRESVASLAYCHRKRAQPNWLHRHFADNRALFQLAALLRVADGLDRARDPQVHITSCKVAKGDVYVEVAGLTREVDQHITKRKADSWPLGFADHSLYLNS